MKRFLLWLLGGLAVAAIVVLKVFGARQTAERIPVPGRRPETPAQPEAPLAGYALAASIAGTTEGYMRAVAHAESGMDQSQRNPSGAAGLYQFMPMTWADLKRRGIDLPPHPGDEAAQHLAMGHFTRLNRETVERNLGRAAQPWELYLAHNQGATGAVKLLLGGPETKASQWVGEAAVAQNFGAGDPHMRTGPFVAAARAYYERHARAVIPDGTRPAAGETYLTEPVFYDDYLEVPRGIWRWPNFTPAEIGGKRQWPHDRTIKIDPHALDCLQALRDEWGEAMTINSGYRSPGYNALVQGAPNSFHKEGKAFDVAMPKSRHDSFIAMARRHGFKGIGRYAAFVHIDTRETPAEWTG